MDYPAHFYDGYSTYINQTFFETFPFISLTERMQFIFPAPGGSRHPFCRKITVSSISTEPSNSNSFFPYLEDEGREGCAAQEEGQRTAFYRKNISEVSKKQKGIWLPGLCLHPDLHWASGPQWHVWPAGDMFPVQHPPSKPNPTEAWGEEDET